MIEYKQEFLCTCLDDFKPMLEKHWEEIAINKDTIRLNPDYDLYYELEEQGVVKCFTARDQDDKPIGYIVFFIRPHIHYKDTMWGMMDILYVDKKYRGTRVAIKLIKFAEQCLQRDGIDVMMLGTKLHKDFGRLLEALGYSPVETFYGKRF